MTDNREHNRQLIEDFRKYRGKPDSPLAGRPLLLLTTTGRKSGNRRTTPLMYIPDGDRFLILASNAGAPAHPDWYKNLLAHPEVGVEVGVDSFNSIAHITEGAERQQLLDKVLALYPFFAEHQAKIARQIPLIVLEHRKGGSAQS